MHSISLYFNFNANKHVLKKHSTGPIRALIPTKITMDPLILKLNLIRRGRYMYLINNNLHYSIDGM